MAAPYAGSRVWHTGDEHYGSPTVIEHCGRPFSSVEEMDEELIARHNFVVGKDDVVFHHGDYTMNARPGLGYLRRLNGTHFLVSGNHDKTFAGNRNGWRYRRTYLDAGFEGVFDYLTMALPPRTRAAGARTVALSHFPYTGDHTEKDRYPEHRPVDGGLWLLHGHVHNAYKISGRGINVGVDVWDFFPVAATTLRDLIDDLENAPNRAP